ncbi:FtsJ-domain-containing protein [Piedraia hortae CBS 480.64]|uniref:Putative tRNA (cytidine(32)/guanosine(34)-2'-O)-methyltransferase n=1 Tax=Piedraia hortae CBS 480.64 TaxID=1314780 RepID=A0A6A7BZR2_9PEZI|nr:FtsJ-domain-containing protein [Piedraia hortae CBS 480.64]
MGKSSKDKRDAYYRLAKEQGWRARSAFKLLQLDQEFDLFSGVTRVVDLCAAPGSWSQVLSRVLIQGEHINQTSWQDTRHNPSPLPHNPPTRPTNNEIKIVAIDLQPMSPLEGIISLKADITHPSTIPLLLGALGEASPSREAGREAPHPRPVDLVLSDGAPDVTGLHDLDIYIQSQLVWAALKLSLQILRPGGRFVAKIFRAKDVDLLYFQLKLLFESVVVAKPRASRKSSLEAFVVCTGFRPLEGVRFGEDEEDSEATASRDSTARRVVNEHGITELDFGDESGNRWIPPFLACGDLSAFDADASHKLPEGYVSLEPVQPPTAPPYKAALEERRKLGGAYGKTKLVG